MPTQDTSLIKEKIISSIRRRGPSLPIHVAKEIDTNTIFASAFLSELLSENEIKISNIKVGNSPLYFIQGQEHLLQNFYLHLKNREKEAFLLLKEKKILKDVNQEPVIRVALRQIKDFAIPFKKQEELFWRYFLFSPQDIKQEKEREIKTKKEIFIPKEKEQPNEEEQKNYNKELLKKPIIIKAKNSKINKKRTQKKNSKFFEKVKEFLSKKEIEILDIESFNKNDLALRIKNKGREEILIAYNKKRINEEDIIKAYKKANELNLNYILLSLGTPLKKFNNLITAIKRLTKIEKID